FSEHELRGTQKSTLFPYTTLFRSKPIRKTAMKESRNLKKEKEKMKIREEIQMKIPRNNPKIRMRMENLIQNREKEILSHSSLSQDRKSTRLNSSHVKISYAVFCSK